MGFYENDAICGQAATTLMQGYPTTAAPPQPGGVVSAVKELMEVIQTNSNYSNLLEQALGISVPEPSQNMAKNPESPSLAQVLRAAVSRLYETNQRFDRAIGHINS